MVSSQVVCNIARAATSILLSPCAAKEQTSGHLEYLTMPQEEAQAVEVVAAAEFPSLHHLSSGPDELHICSHFPPALTLLPWKDAVLCAAQAKAAKSQSIVGTRPGPTARIPHDFQVTNVSWVLVELEASDARDNVKTMTWII